MRVSHLSTVLGAAVSVLAFDASAVAATLTSIQGQVRVNSGSGFHQVSQMEEVAPGTSIMVSSGGSAEVLYSDGCRMPAEPGLVVTVAPISPCAQGQAEPPQDVQDNTALYVVGGVAVVAGGAAAVVLTQNRSSPASP
jgi:hypothetical protein